MNEIIEENIRKRIMILNQWTIKSNVVVESEKMTAIMALTDIDKINQ